MNHSNSKVDIMHRLILIIVVFILISACASTNVTPLNEDLSANSLEADEKELWDRSADVEKTINQDLNQFDLATLDRYLNSVLAKLPLRKFGDQIENPRIRAIPDIEVNAFVLPNGATYINTGLLAMMENEAQLAFVLSHEISHFELRHGLKNARAKDNSRKRGILAAFVLQTVLANTGGYVPGNSLTKSAGELLGASLSSSYSRESEHEADERGFELLSNAGYDTAAGMGALEKLREAAEKTGFKGGGLFASHPKIEQRIESYNAIISEPSSLSSSGMVGTQEYFNHLLPALVVNTKLNLRAQRPDVAIADLQRYVTNKGKNATTHFLFGEVARNANSAQPEIAIGHYENAVRTDPQYANAYLELGHLYSANNMPQQSKTAFESYLRLKPNSPEAAIVQQLLSEI